MIPAPSALLNSIFSSPLWDPQINHMVESLCYCQLYFQHQEAAVFNVKALINPHNQMALRQKKKARGHIKKWKFLHLCESGSWWKFILEETLWAEKWQWKSFNFPCPAFPSATTAPQARIYRFRTIRSQNHSGRKSNKLYSILQINNTWEQTEILSWWYFIQWKQPWNRDGR